MLLWSVGGKQEAGNGVTDHNSLRQRRQDQHPGFALLVVFDHAQPFEQLVPATRARDECRDEDEAVRAVVSEKEQRQVHDRHVCHQDGHCGIVSVHCAIQDQHEVKNDADDNIEIVGQMIDRGKQEDAA